MTNIYTSPNTNKKNSSEDEIANVNFLYDDIVHARQNTIDSCIDSATDRRGTNVTDDRQTDDRPQTDGR